MDSRAFARAHDAYLDPDRYYGHQDPPPPLRCVHCGAFLPLKPDEVKQGEILMECDGTEVIHEEPYTEGLVAILGEEFRGQTYQVSSSTCGIDMGPHEPHTEDVWVWEERHHTCRRCGQDNRIVE